MTTGHAHTLQNCWLRISKPLNKSLIFFSGQVVSRFYIVNYMKMADYGFARTILCNFRLEKVNLRFV